MNNGQSVKSVVLPFLASRCGKPVNVCSTEFLNRLYSFPVTTVIIVFLAKVVLIIK